MSEYPLMITVSGIRGIAHKSVTYDLIHKYVGSFAEYLKKEKGNEKVTIVLGRDSRVSGPEFEKDLVEFLVSLGADVKIIGICPTPTIQFLVPVLHVNGGIIITSSHNPEEWNGLKFVGSDGLFLKASYCEIVYGNARNHTAEHPAFTVLTDKSLHGKQEIYGKGMDDHINSTLSLLSINVDQIKSIHFKVALDTINGAGSVYIPFLLDKLGVEIVAKLNIEPNGKFAHTPEPVPENLTSLCEAVKQSKADLGIAVDPDADRLVLIDETGVPLGEEYTLALCTEYVLGVAGRRGAVCKNLSSSRAVDDIARKHQSVCYPSAVGEANVAELMIKEKAVFGGEGNGGVMDPKVHIGRDSIVGIALVFQFLAHSRTTDYITKQLPSYTPPASASASASNNNGVTISQIKSTLPQYEIVKDKVVLSASLQGPAVDTLLVALCAKWKDGATVSTVDGVHISVESERWWVHVRKSNTEPIVRIIAEAPTKEKALERVAFFKGYFTGDNKL